MRSNGNMKPTKKKKAMSNQARFVFGGVIGVAISVPIFGGIDSAPVKAILMIAFAGIMGYAQVIAGKIRPAPASSLAGRLLEEYSQWRPELLRSSSIPSHEITFRPIASADVQNLFRC